MAKLDYRAPEWVAEQLGIDKNTVYKHLQDGTIPAVQLGRKWLISESELAEWLKSQTHSQTEARRQAAASTDATSRRMTNYTPRAREVIRVAHAEARRYSHNYLGQEHLILAIAADPECTAACAIARAGASLDDIRALVEARIPPGDAVAKGRLARSPSNLKAMRLAKREAQELGGEAIGTEHLLLGILKAGEGPGFEVLTEIHMTYGPTRDAIARLRRPD